MVDISTSPVLKRLTVKLYVAESRTLYIRLNLYFLGEIWLSVPIFPAVHRSISLVFLTFFSVSISSFWTVFLNLPICDCVYIFIFVSASLLPSSFQCIPLCLWLLVFALGIYLLDYHFLFLFCFLLEKALW